MAAGGRFQYRNENFCQKSKNAMGYAEAYAGTPHKQSRRLTQRFGKKTIYEWKLINLKTFVNLLEPGLTEPMDSKIRVFRI